MDDALVGSAPKTLDGWAATALLDALPDATAVLDGDGTIVAVNHAWRMFAIDNGGSVEHTGVGVNYLAVCERAAATGCADAAEVGNGLRAVMNGDTVDSELEYPCPSPAVGRWFALRVTPVAGRQPGLLVSHVNISRRKTAERVLERRASQDPLTGLANRSMFDDRLAAAMTPDDAPVLGSGVLYLDLDGFKPINDTYGHPAGDEVLQTVAARLVRDCREQDTVARMGGDEFAVVAPKITAAGLAALASRLRKVLARPHLVHGHQVVIGASVGTYLLGEGDTGADAVRRADAAMYVAKRSRAA